MEDKERHLLSDELESIAIGLREGDLELADVVVELEGFFEKVNKKYMDEE